MQAVGPAASGHQPARELVHDDHFAVLDDVVHVAVVHRVRPQALDHVVHQVHVGQVVEVRHAQRPLHLLVAFLGERGRPGLLLDRVVHVPLEHRDDAVDAVVEVGRVLGRPRDDQRRAGLVDQDAVHLVDDGVVQLSLHAVRQVPHHVVAQVVEPEFVVGAVSDVGAVGLLAGAGAQVLEALVLRLVGRVVEERRLVLDHAHGQAQAVVEGAHPLGVALGQVVVDRDEVRTLAFERVEVEGQRGDQGLAFPGLHLRDLALVQDHAADELDVEVAHLQLALRHLPADSEGVRQDVIRRGPVGQALFELVGLRPQVEVREQGQGRLLGVDLGDQRLESLELALVLAAEDLAEQDVDHGASVPTASSSILNCPAQRNSDSP